MSVYRAVMCYHCGNIQMTTATKSVRCLRPKCERTFQLRRSICRGPYRRPAEASLVVQAWKAHKSKNLDEYERILEEERRRARKPKVKEPKKPDPVKQKKRLEGQVKGFMGITFRKEELSWPREEPEKLDEMLDDLVEQELLVRNSDGSYMVSEMKEEEYLKAKKEGKKKGKGRMARITEELNNLDGKFTVSELTFNDDPKMMKLFKQLVDAGDILWVYPDQYQLVDKIGDRNE